MNKIRKMLPLATTALLAACVNDSEPQLVAQATGEPISFSTAISPATRNSFVEGNFTEFKVSATGNSETYFTGLTVSKTTTEGVSTWAPAAEDEKNWPGYALKFYAYAPTDLTGVSITNSGQTVTDFTPSATVASQTDLITTYNTGTAGTVSLNFKHALSQIEVLATNDNTTDYTVKVIGVKLGKIPSTATMNFQQTTTDYASWGTASTPATYLLRGTADDVVTLNGEAQSIMFGDDCFQLIPQQLSAWTAGASADGAYLSVLCQIIKNDGNLQVYPDDNGKYGYSAVPIDTQWKPGHKYVYTLNFFKNGGAGQIDPDPVPSGDDIDPSPGGDGSEGGNPVAGGKITYSVSITDWVTEDGDRKDIDL